MISNFFAKRLRPRILPSLRRRPNEAGVSAPQAIPHQVHLEYLRNVSEATALLFATGFAKRNHSTNLSWVGAHSFRKGYVIEVHEGGSGESYWTRIVRQPSVTAVDETDDVEHSVSFVIPTSSSRLVMIEVTKAGVATFLLPEGESRPVSDLGADSPGKGLTPADHDYMTRALRHGAIALKGVLVLAALAVLFRPTGSVVRITAHPDEPPPPLAAFSAPVPDGHHIVRIELVGGQWVPVIEPLPVEFRPSLRRPQESPRAAN